MEKTSILKKYLNDYGIKQNWFAKQIGVSRKTICTVCNGAKCSAIIALKIEDFTDGMVKAEDVCWNKDEIKTWKGNL